MWNVSWHAGFDVLDQAVRRAPETSNWNLRNGSLKEEKISPRPIFQDSCWAWKGLQDRYESNSCNIDTVPNPTKSCTAHVVSIEDQHIGTTFNMHLSAIEALASELLPQGSAFESPVLPKDPYTCPGTASTSSCSKAHHWHRPQHRILTAVAFCSTKVRQNP